MAAEPRMVNARRPHYAAGMSATTHEMEFVDVETARTARGVRMAVSAMVPSPWSEAAKGLFRVAGVRVLAVRSRRADAAVVGAWTGVDNVPVVFHDDEPPRTNWAAITTLAARLAGPDQLLPYEPRPRAEAMGLLHEIAGEEGIGWNGRLAMIDVSIESGGKRGFPLPVAQYLARRYGYTPEARPGIRARITTQLAMFHDRLRVSRDRGHMYLGGARVSALDIYLATFLTPLSAIPEEACPALDPTLRRAFASAHEEFGELV
ncbi:MAG: hypothetical protein H0T79_19115, partial [Deltaproteobacteria bacterium]|nr:hypothetical protein [Deltaproteobacteria bacterium]